MQAARLFSRRLWNWNKAERAPSGQMDQRCFFKGKHSLRLEMGTEEFVHQDATFDANSEVHAYGQRMWPNGVVQQGQFVHGSLKAAEVA